DVDIPGSELAALPRYPSSTRVGYRQTTTDTLVETRVEYVTSDDLAQVHSFYRGAFAENGWFVADLDFSQRERYFFVVNGVQEARVRVTDDERAVTIRITHSEPL